MKGLPFPLPFLYPSLLPSVAAVAVAAVDSRPSLSIVASTGTFFR